MSDESHPAVRILEFTRLAIRHLGKWPQWSMQAQTEMMDRWQHAHRDAGPDDLALEKATLQLRTGAGAGGERAITRGMQHRAVVWCALLLILISFLGEVMVEHLMTDRGNRLGIPIIETIADRRIHEVAPQPLAPNFDLARLEAAQRESPDDPVTYQVWVMSLIYREARLPEDYDARWRRIDPGNGFWLTVKADFLGKKAVFPRRAGKAKTWDPELLQQSIHAMEEAAAQPFWMDRKKEIFARQRKLLRPPRTLAENKIAVQEFNGIPESMADCYLAYGPTYCAAQRLREQGDLAGLANLLDAWATLAEKVVSQKAKASDACYSADGLAFEARKAGLSEQTARLKALANGKDPAAYSVGYEDGLASVPSGVGFAYPGSEKEDFLPRLHAEHARRDRLNALAWVGGILALILLTRCFIRSPGYHLAAGFDPLFPRPWRLVAFGVLLPAAIWAGLTYLTPAGLRDYGLRTGRAGFGSVDVGLAGIRWLSGFLMILHTLSALIHQEGARCAGFLGIGNSRPRADWTFAGLALAACAIPPSFYSTSENVNLAILSCLLLPGLLFLIWRCLLGVARTGLPVGSILILRRYDIPLMALCGLLLAGVPCLRLAETRWLQNDPLNVAGPEETRFRNVIEDRLFQEMQIRLKQGDGK